MNPAANLNMIYHFTGEGIPVLKIREFHDGLTIIMGITIPGKMVLILKQGIGMVCIWIIPVCDISM